MTIVGGPFAHTLLSDKANKNIFSSYRNLKWTISGRAALHCILSDIIKRTKKRNIWIPAFYCPSVVQLIKNLGFTIYYYDINVKNGKIEYSVHEQVEGIFLFMRYYGFSEYSDLLNEIKGNKETILIEDLTHSLLCKKIDLNIDYYFASVRKWLGVCTGGFLLAPNRNITCSYGAENNKLNYFYKSFIEQYGLYMNTGDGIRDYFRDCFWKCELALEHSTVGYDICIDDKMKIMYWDSDTVKQIRRRNAICIVESIVNKEYLIYKTVESDDVPFFVPILLKSRKERDILCRLLDENNIFCNISWERPTDYYGCSNIIETDFGLVCDERYSIDEINRMMEIVNMWLLN